MILLFKEDQKVEIKPQISLTKYKSRKMQLHTYTELGIIVRTEGKITSDLYLAYLGISL